MSVICRLLLLALPVLATIATDDINTGVVTTNGDSMAVMMAVTNWAVYEMKLADELEILNNGNGNNPNKPPSPGVSPYDCQGGGNNGVDISCDVPRLWFQDDFRNCCPSTGLCADSACQVFGFQNSAKSNCPGAAGGAGGGNDCLGIVACNYTGNCNADQENPDPRCPNLKNHCYGNLVCIKPGGCSGTRFASLINSVCLEDGNSVNFKICGSGPADSPEASSSESPSASASPAASESPSPAASESPSPAPIVPSPPASQSDTGTEVNFVSPERSPLPSPSPSPECDRCATVDKDCEDHTKQLTDGKYTLERDLKQCVDPELFALRLNEYADADFQKDNSKVQSYGCQRVSHPPGCNTIKCEHYIPEDALQAVLTLTEFGGMEEIFCKIE